MVRRAVFAFAAAEMVAGATGSSRRCGGFSSVKVNGTSVLACRNRNFRSYCVVLNEDHASLEGLLDNGISSIHVY